MLAKSITALPAILVFAVLASAQHTPPPPAVTTMPQSRVTRPDSIQDAGLYGYWNHMTDQDRAGGALLGKVVVSGELLPWDPILVTLSCKDSTVYTTQTDPKGYFAVLPSRIPGELSLQGDRQRQMQVHFEGCVLKSFLTGFRSSTITVTERNLRDDPDVGTIALTRDAQSRGTAMSTTSRSAPESAAKYWSKAAAAILEQKPDRASRELEKAVQAYPGFADAWYQLGRLQMVSSPRDAKICLQKAVTADPNFVSPYEPLAALSLQQEDWQSTMDNANRYLQLDPSGTMHIWYYLALANFQLGNVEAAESNAKRLVAVDPLHNIRNGEQLLAAILARKADYPGAIAHLRNCLTYIPDGPDAQLLKDQIAQLEKHVSVRN